MLPAYTLPTAVVPVIMLVAHEEQHVHLNQVFVLYWLCQYVNLSLFMQSFIDEVGSFG